LFEAELLLKRRDERKGKERKGKERKGKERTVIDGILGIDVSKKSARREHVQLQQGACEELREFL
jgi:hypothetical protein